MAFFEAVNSTTVSGLTAPMFGHLYEDKIDSLTIIGFGAANTFVGWTTATAGELQGVTADVADGTADHLTVPADGAGDYVVVMKVDGKGASNEIYEWSVHVDGSQKTELTAISYNPSGDGGAQLSFAAGVISLSASEEVSIRVQNLTSTGNYEIRSAQLTIQRIPG
jgi:hypothetical protein